MSVAEPSWALTRPPTDRLLRPSETDTRIHLSLSFTLLPISERESRASRTTRQCVWDYWSTHAICLAVPALPLFACFPQNACLPLLEMQPLTFWTYQINAQAPNRVLAHAKGARCARSTPVGFFTHAIHFHSPQKSKC